MSDRNKATIRTIREKAVGRSGAELNVLDGLYSEGYRYHGGAFGELDGSGAFKNLLQGCRPRWTGIARRLWTR